MTTLSPSLKHCTKSRLISTRRLRRSNSSRSAALSTASRLRLLQYVKSSLSRPKHSSTSPPSDRHCRNIHASSACGSSNGVVISAAFPRKRVGVPPAAQRRGGVPPPHRFGLHRRRRGSHRHPDVEQGGGQSCAGQHAGEPDL